MKFFRNIINEVLIVFAYILVLNNFIVNTKDTIHSDGLGYYDYLPSIFIHHDFVRHDKPLSADTSAYTRINKIPFYNSYKDFKVNKYPCGTALLELPFFMTGYVIKLANHSLVDGYEPLFHQMIFYAALFYVFLSIYFLKKLLKLFEVRGYLIFFVQLLTVLATSVTIYAQFDGSYSHVYSLFAITAFLYYSKKYFVSHGRIDFTLALLFLGLIFDLRHVNIIILGFLPFLAGSIDRFKSGIVYAFTNAKILLLGVAACLSIVAVQCLIWYMQTGDLFVYSYTTEKFNFTDPYFYSILFSYKKGLFVYTPVLFIISVSIFYFIKRREYYLFSTWILFFVFVTYILSSWWAWFYGCSYGLRAFVEFYPVFFIPFAVLLNNMNRNLRIALIVVSALTIPVNIIQSYQYRSFILDWIEMKKDWYWEVFLKTSDKYIGLISKRPFNMDWFKVTGEIPLGDVRIKSKMTKEICSINTSKIPDYNSMTNFKLQFDAYISDKSNSWVIATISGPTYYFYHKIPFIHFREIGFDKFQTGQYTYGFKPVGDKGDHTLTIMIESDDLGVDIKNAKLIFIAPKY